MIQVFPRLTTSEHMDGTRRHTEAASPLGSGDTPAVLFFVPIIQDVERLLFGEGRMWGAFSLQPHIVSTEPTGLLNGAWKLAS